MLNEIKEEIEYIVIKKYPNTLIVVDFNKDEVGHYTGFLAQCFYNKVKVGEAFFLKPDKALEIGSHFIKDIDAFLTDIANHINLLRSIDN